MEDPPLPEAWAALCRTQHAEAIRECLNGVFRRLLANLLLDFHNPKFRQVKKDNKALCRATGSLPCGFVDFLFTSIGFTKNDDGFLFEGTPESLKQGDVVFSQIEQAVDKDKREAAELETQRLRGLAAERVATTSTPVEPPPPLTHPARSSRAFREADTFAEVQRSNRDKDVAEAEALKDVVRKTLLNTGRVRNCFFEARDFTVRIMRHGRVYACTEKCADLCIEAHWHLLTGRNILYSHLAHLSADGTRLLHLGPEHGYQYNSLPGSTNFGKMVHFSEKLLDENGKLVQIKTDDKPVSTCIYCGRLFSDLLL
ncbi:PUB domain containing protein [Novymonas esmeraldas]|uniref:PUB domain containing protein n=1 Tax=Novymonas esmeraldas TaxID=1808958 RepID=A0AAW0EY99_9TRYP